MRPCRRPARHPADRPGRLESAFDLQRADARLGPPNDHGGAGRRFVQLTELTQVPLGTVFDTTAGRVTLISASDTRGGTRHAWFYSGIFKVGQTRGAHPITTLAPAGDKPTSAPQASAADNPALGLHVWLPAPT